MTTEPSVETATSDVWEPLLREVRYGSRVRFRSAKRMLGYDMPQRFVAVEIRQDLWDRLKEALGDG